MVCPEHLLALGQQAQGWPGLHNKRSLLKIKIYQDTYCKGHIRTALPGTCTSQGKGLETHRGQQQLHTGSDYCICKARKKKKKKGQKEESGPEDSLLPNEKRHCATTFPSRHFVQHQEIVL